MVNYSTNINKTNNHLSHKESLNEVVVGFVDISGIVDHHCLNFL
jgi:hypothetical protein